MSLWNDRLRELRKKGWLIHSHRNGNCNLMKEVGHRDYAYVENSDGSLNWKITEAVEYAENEIISESQRDLDEY